MVIKSLVTYVNNVSFTSTGSNKTKIMLSDRQLRCDIGKVDVCTFQVVSAVAPQLSTY